MSDSEDRAPYRSMWTDLQGVSFSQDYVRVGDVDTRYLQAGSSDKPELIFLHGTGGHAEAYVRNLSAHAEHFNTYAIDMLGHGFTGKPDYDYEIPRYIDYLLGFIDALGIDKVPLGS